jgi:hypothetical protein
VAVVEDKKPDIRELVGIAVNTSVLTMKEGQERALDRIAALGAAGLAVHDRRRSGAGRRRRVSGMSSTARSSTSVT